MGSRECGAGEVGVGAGKTGPWSVEDFCRAMEETRERRREMVRGLLADRPALPAHPAQELSRLHSQLEAAAVESRLALTMPPSTDIRLNVQNELTELRRDEALVASGGVSADGRVALDAVLSQVAADERAAFLAEAHKVASLLRPGLPGLVLLTDWDGTMKDYGSNYATCVQPAHSALVLGRFAREATAFAGVLTAGPLRDPGLLDLLTLPLPGARVAVGGSWGREWLVDGQRFVQDSKISTESRAALAELAAQVQALLDQSFPKVKFTGSGFQRKVDRLTLGLQNVAAEVSEAEVERLVAAVDDVLLHLDPDGLIFHSERSAYDLEVILRSEGEGGVWDKGAGVAFLEELDVGLDLASAAMVLVCGDTESDVAMLRRCVERAPDTTRAVFVSPSDGLRRRVVEVFGGREERVEWVSAPGVLHAAFALLINERLPNP